MSAFIRRIITKKYEKVDYHCIPLSWSLPKQTLQTEQEAIFILVLLYEYLCIAGNKKRRIIEIILSILKMPSVGLFFMSCHVMWTPCLVCL